MNLFLRFATPGLLLVVTLAGCQSTSPVRVASGQHARKFETTLTRQISIPYLLFLPADYQQTVEKKWPLLVFLHGAGERGDDLEKVTVHGPPKLVKDRPDFPFVVASPQCREGEIWNADALDSFLASLLNDYAIDPSRVYLTGLSMGGYGTWAWAAEHPERFAAIVPICGGGDPIRVRLASGARKEHLARLPIWAFHGAKDPVVSLNESERMIDAYGRVGNQGKLTVYPDAGHDSWTETYGNPALYDWLLQQRRP